MRAKHATYNLGIDFHDFVRIGERYVHPFGTFGEKVAGVPFHHYWLELAARGMAGPIGDYSLAVAAAKANRFAPPAEDDSLRSTYGYAYQFDRSEEHTSKIQSLMRTSYAVFCLKKKKKKH